ncbi:bifunctional nuclease 2-like [Zingiber officinale]|uniref:bifunctional nuclease 2-like n=1 Tax=Zingiber officinale TaxID=94328 RepID=UPI001C4BE5DB|nr:bifunctional nuclease 2-like [Zingiber officinale]
MQMLKGSVVSQPSVLAHANHVASFAPLPNMNPAKARNFRSIFFGSYGRLKSITRACELFVQPCEKKTWAVCCIFSSSSDGNGSLAGNFDENDEEFVNSSVLEAVEARSESDGLVIKMHDGRSLRCVHNSPQAGNLPYYPPHPAIVLKVEDGSDTLLPLLVVEMSSVLLIAAICQIQLVRPTMYEVVQELIEKMGYAVHLVRITKRIKETYFAKLYLTKVGSKNETISFDIRPSDAINMAVRCKVPIQVNKDLALRDGMKIAEPTKLAVKTVLSYGALFTELDRPDGQPCNEAIEFDMVRNMLIAAVEERYKDAARWRNKLFLHRSKTKSWP